MALSQLLRRGRFETLVRMSQATVDRLQTTCFRGKDQNFAGNFSRWSSVEEMMADEGFRDDFLYELHSMDCDRVYGTVGIQLESRSFVGWSSTERACLFRLEDTEEFRLNKRSVARRIKLDRHEIRAPKTKLVTVTVEFKTNGRHRLAIIHSLYPGVDVGKLSGDMTKEDGVVFFNFGHPGE